MQFIRRLSFLAFSGPKVWFAINIVIFVILFFVYKSLVSPTQNPQNYILPSDNGEALKNSMGTTSKEGLNAGKERDYASLLTINPLQSVEQVTSSFPSIDYVVKSGDSLARIFARFGLSKESMYAVLEADQEYLVLDPLLPNDKYTFKLNEDGELIQLTRRIDKSKSVSFVRHENGGFSYEEYIKQITYVQSTIHSKVIGNFYVSAKKVGLSDTNILIIHDVLKGRVDFRKDLRKNDAFDIVVKNGNIDGVQVGETQLEALQMTVQGQTYRAFLHSDGRFYDQNGKSLTPALGRWPTKKQYRISSSFNANRLHPITGHPAPHNGVDLATPIGTEVLSTGDGVVTRIESHKYAGRYIVMDYAGPYGARFLHLSRILVKKGQKVKRGQVIALSGNTGRTTGAHLHYELHIRGRPVNPMKARFPTTQSIPRDEIAAFDNNVATWINMMAGGSFQDNNESA